MRTLRSNRFVLIFLLSERIVDYYSNLWFVAWLPSGMQPYRIFYSILCHFISSPCLSYCLRLPTGGSVSVMRTTAVRSRLRAMAVSKDPCGEEGIVHRLLSSL